MSKFFCNSTSFLSETYQLKTMYVQEILTNKLNQLKWGFTIINKNVTNAKSEFISWMPALFTLCCMCIQDNLVWVHASLWNLWHLMAFRFYWPTSRPAQSLTIVADGYFWWVLCRNEWCLTYICQLSVKSRLINVIETNILVLAEKI